MPATTTRNLFLQISGSSDGLTKAAKAARSAMLDISSGATDLQKVVQDRFAQLAGSDPAQSARALESAYRKTFTNIRAAAEQTLSQPVSAVGIINTNVAGAETALAAARASAAAYRDLADAQLRVVAANPTATAGERELAVVLETQALAAKESVAGLETQLVVLKQLQTESIAAAGASEEVAGTVVAGHTRMGASGLILEHVLRSTGDSFAAGLPPAQIFAEQLGRVSEAAVLLGGGEGGKGVLGAIGGFLGGPWGIALSLGVAVLAPFIASLFDTKKAAEEAKKATADFANFQDDLANFIDKANGKLVERNRLLAEGAKVQRSSAINTEVGKISSSINSAADEISAKVTAGGRSRAGPSDVDLSRISLNLRTTRDINAAKDALQALVKTRPDLGELAASVNAYAGSANLAAHNVHKLRGEQMDLDTALHGGVVGSTALADRQVARTTAATPVEKAQVRIDDIKARATAIDALPAGAEKTAELAKYTAELTEATKAYRAAQQASKDATANRQVGRQITEGEAKSIVEGIGGRVTSGQRSTAQQQVLYDRYLAGTGSLAAKPGTSLHERGQAVDVAKGPGISIAALKKAFEDAGVHITELLDEGNHYHVGFGKKGPSAEQQQKTAANDDKAYTSEVQQAQNAYKTALLGLSDTAESRYTVETDNLNLALAARLREIDDQVVAGKIPGQTSAEVDANAEVLRQLAKKTTGLQLQNAKVAEASAIMDRQIENDQANLQAGLAVLQSRSPLLVGRNAEYANAQAILANQQASNRDAIATRINNAPKDPNDASKAVVEAQTLPDVEANQQQALAKQYEGPLQSYITQIKGNMDDAFQNVGVNALHGLEDGLVGIVTGTESVKQAFTQMATSIIADLARIAIEKAVVSVFSLGLKDGGVVGFAAGGIPGYASGGSPTNNQGLIRGPGTSRSDSILAVVGGRKLIKLSNGEGVANARTVQQYWPVIDSMNKGTFKGFADGGLPDIPRPADLSRSDIRSLSPQHSRAAANDDIAVHVTPSPYFDVAVARVASPMAQQSMIGGARQAAEDRHDEAYSAIPQ